MFSAGSVVAGYRIERQLGAGGMGAVYLAQNPTLPRLDALKVLSAELSHNPEFRARFVREADVASGLTHPNIVSIYRRGETEDGQLWIAMQYVDGTDADAALRAGRMPPGRAVFVVSEVAKALDYAHARNVVHRDVKPANFLLSNEGGVERVLLGDFGIARALDDVGLTMTGAVLATVAYAAPEVLSGSPFDGRADLYSLGCTLYGLLTGLAPFADSNGVPAVMMAHLETPPPRVTDRMPGLPPAMDWVIATAMAKDPARRFQSGAELAAAAAAALAGRDPTALVRAPAPQWYQPGDSPRTAMAAPVRPAPSKRNRARLAALAGVGVLAVAGTVTAVVTTGGPDDSATPTTDPSTATNSAVAPVPPNDVTNLLLPTSEIDRIMGVPMTLDTDSPRMNGSSRNLAEKECAGAFAPGQQVAYAGSGYISTAQQSFSKPSPAPGVPAYRASQIVTGFASANSADSLFDQQAEQWRQCATRTLTLGPPEQPVPVVLGDFADVGDRTITLVQGLENAQGWTCARAMAVRRNIVIDTYTCATDNAIPQSRAIIDEITKNIDVA